MAQHVILLVLVFISCVAVDRYFRFQRHLRAAKRSGIPYVIVPWFMLDRFWLLTHLLWLKPLRKLPRRYTEWVDFLLPGFSWDYRHKIFERVGHDTFMTVSPGGNFLWTCDPPVITQITTRRNDFPKPTHIYRSIDIYGKNVVTSEGALWRHHRKATSPPFTEKNNHVVWGESIDQAQAMLTSWVGPDGKGNRTVTRIMDDTMRLSLHVISRAGFGRKIEWPAVDATAPDGVQYVEEDSKIKNVTEDTDEGHKMSYVYSLHCLLDTILFQFLFPRWTLRHSPFARLRTANDAFVEWGKYMQEMVAAQKQALKDGAKGERLDIISQLVKGQVTSQSEKDGNNATLTDAEIYGNMFVLIIAGHETSANSIHFSILYLAMYPDSQRRLQRELDAIFHGLPPSQWDYDRDLPALFAGMTGAILAEELRLVPPVINIPKSTFGVGEQKLTVEGRECTVPRDTQIAICTAAAHRNPNVWPLRPPTYPGGKTVHPIANLDNDLEEFRPERWLLSDHNQTHRIREPAQNRSLMTEEKLAGDDLGVNEAADTSDRLYKPPKGAYVPFSDGYRSCLGRRFGQVEVLATLAVIFQNYSVELAVDKYASDAELEKMDEFARAKTWQKAAEDARDLMLTGCGVIITLQMRKGAVGVRFVPRGQEKFAENVDELGKPPGPGVQREPGWRAWAHNDHAHTML